MTLKINQGTKFGTLKKPMFSLLDVIIFQFTGIMKHEIIAFPKGFHFVVASHHWSATLILPQWNSDFSNHLGKSKLVWIIKRFEKTWLKLLCLTGEGKVGLVWIIRNFKKQRVWEIGILLSKLTFVVAHNILYIDRVLEITRLLVALEVILILVKQVVL